MSRRITILGATGSVGRSTLSLMGEHRERFRVDTLTANTDVEGLAELARRHGARHAVVAQESRYLALKEALAGTGIEAAAGQEALCEAASRPVDIVMAAIVGVAGLAPALAAVRSQPVVALANKESLVCAGALFMSEVRRCGTLLLRSIPNTARSFRRSAAGLSGRSRARCRAGSHHYRFGRSVPQPPRQRTFAASASRKRSTIRSGRWERRFPSIPPR